MIERRKTGRPEKPADKKRSEFVSLRFTPAEADALWRAARRYGWCASDLVIALVRRHLRATEGVDDIPPVPPG
jgi:hypothetical protein